MNPLQQLASHGQAIWLDHFQRKLLKGELERLIEQDGLKGLTSNPAILQKAFAEASDYADDIREQAREAGSPKQLYEALVVRDMRAAADQFRPLYDSSGGSHGWVSLEVDPRLAFDTAGTVREARRLHEQLSRPNVLIKVPATREGLPAIEQLISEGISINVTLLFGLPRYIEVLGAYMAGLEQRARQGQEISKVRSVASFFLSRIDTLVDARLQDVAQRGGARSELAKQVYGQVAVASAKLAYHHYLELSRTNRWQDLSRQGARPQWLLWASTSTKNPSFDELKYVEPLIGPETINTMPPSTLAAYRERGQPKARLPEDLERSQVILERLIELGIDIDGATAKLEAQGVEKFTRPFEEFLQQLERRLEAA